MVRLVFCRDWCGAALLFFLLVSGGCATLEGPEYKRPTAPVKTAWGLPGKGVVSGSTPIDKAWWKKFGDEDLDRLVNQAVEQNIDLKILAARTGVAEAVIGQVKAAALPSLDIGLGSSTTRTTGQNTVTQYNAATSVNWEIDIWGKVRQGALAREAEVRASNADWRAGYLSLVSDVATAYFQILTFDEQAARQREALGDAEKTLAILEDLHREGIIATTQVLQQKAEINQLKRGLLELQRTRQITENALATLLGVPAGDLRVEPGSLTRKVHLFEVPVGLPSTLLSRRPDIIAAEYRVLKAHNLSNEARLAKLPSFGLTGRVGTSAFSVSDLLKSFTGGFLPSLNIPILDPAVRARERVTNAEAKVAREMYRKVVITAFEEVENALVNLNSRYRQREELVQQLEKLRLVADQVREKLREGMVSQLEVFESERSLLRAKLALLENKRQILADTVQLYKALGGGWGEEVVDAR